MRRLLLAAAMLLILVGSAGATIVNETSFPGTDFSNTVGAPTDLGVTLGCSPFPACVPSPPGYTDQVNGALFDLTSPVVLSDPTDVFSFTTGAIDGVILTLTGSANTATGTVDLYNPVGTLFASYSFSGQLTNFDLLSAWGLGTSGDLVADVPGGSYAIGVNVTNWNTTNGTLAYTFNITAAPEPGTYLLVGLGLAALALVRRRRV